MNKVHTNILVERFKNELINIQDIEINNLLFDSHYLMDKVSKWIREGDAVCYLIIDFKFAERVLNNTGMDLLAELEELVPGTIKDDFPNNDEYAMVIFNNEDIDPITFHKTKMN